MGIISKKPITNVRPSNIHISIGSEPPDCISMKITTAIAIARAMLIKCRAGSIIGVPDIFPFSFAKAMTEPENVIAPIPAPRASSNRLKGLMPSAVIIPKLSGLKKAATATSTAAKPCD